MSFRPSPLALAMAAVFGTLVAAPAQALTITETTGFKGATIVNDVCNAAAAKTCGDGDTSAAPAILATPSLNQFNASNGVLLGTSIILESTRNIFLDGAFSGSPVSGAETTGKGASQTTLTAPGVAQTHALANVTGTGTATVTNPTGKFNVLESKITNQTTIVGAADLNSYVGTGTASTTLAAKVFEVGSTWKNATATSASSSANLFMPWSGTVAAQYDYLLHARPSFDSPAPVLSLDLDFGTLFLNELATDIPFSIFNLAGDRVGLDLDSVFGSGDISKLTTNLLSFTSLAEGDDLDFLASFDTSSLGSFAASYTLCFSDEDVGASASRYDCTIDPGSFLLTLNLQGRVVRRDAIPEPATLGLLGIGLAGLAWRRRRR